MEKKLVDEKVGQSHVTKEFATQLAIMQRDDICALLGSALTHLRIEKEEKHGLTDKELKALKLKVTIGSSENSLCFVKRAVLQRQNRLSLKKACSLTS
jgi:hypothetical protein